MKATLKEKYDKFEKDFDKTRSFFSKVKRLFDNFVVKAFVNFDFPDLDFIKPDFSGFGFHIDMYEFPQNIFTDWVFPEFDFENNLPGIPSINTPEIKVPSFDIDMPDFENLFDGVPGLFDDFAVRC